MCHTGTNAVDHRFRRAPGNALPLHHRGYDRIEEDYFGDPRCSMARDVPGQFAAARRMPNQYCAAKIKLVHELGKIIGPRINIVTGSRLIGRAVSPPVMGDGAVTLGIEKQHLCFPRRTGQWPAVRENNRRSRAPVTIVDSSTVTGFDCWHGISPLLAERPMQHAGHHEPCPSLARRRRCLQKRIHTLQPEFVAVNGELPCPTSTLRPACRGSVFREPIYFGLARFSSANGRTGMECRGGGLKYVAAGREVTSLDITGGWSL